MPTTPDRPGDSDDPFAVAEAAQVARDTEPVGVQRPTEAVEAGAQSREQRTILVDDKLLAGRETVKLPSQRRPQGPPRRAPLPVAALFATLWAALLSYVPVAAVIGLARTLEGSGGLAGAAHAGLAGWLLGHGVAIGTSIGSLGLSPLLLSLLAVWRLSRAGLHVTRAVGARRSRSTARALGVAFAIALIYSLLGSVAALAVDGRGTEVTPGRAALNFFLIGGAGALAGSLSGTDALSVWADRLPRPLRHGVRAGVVAALLVLACGAVVTGLSVAVGGGQAADMISAYRTGVAGQAGITLVSLAYGANGAVWAAAYLLGPGFALGTGSAVQLTEVTVGPLPTLPLLAALPNGPMGATGALLLALPVLAGFAAGWLLTLRLTRARPAPAPKPLPWPLVLGTALLAGPVAGIVLGLLAAFSGGPLGDGRMATIGPDPWVVGLVATAVLGVSTAIGAAAARMVRPLPKG
ncbi:cell division protein PerM [Actinoplanes sp. URMC 104]|uniref:cell division protein PerM n=1 Tax=Actinoplanes sp. URMC 104 TaxID=3423409 RepID=UPI003F1D7CE0